MAMRTIGGLALAAIGLLCVSATATATGGSAPKPKNELPALTAPRHADGVSRALRSGQIDEAQAALYRAQALLQPAAVERRFGAVATAGPRDATMILRDLFLRVDELSPPDRQRATALLARPSDTPGPFGGWSTTEAVTSPECGTHVCVHWTTAGGDQPAPTDTTPANSVPDWVDTTLAEMENTVWADEVTAMGYRAPKSDLTSDENGGGALFDVYISNLGPDSIYGYCTSDDPNAGFGSAYKFYDFSAYCVVDNNYAERIFRAHTRLENLQVTLAHEFFHAVQFAYDATEDLWLMEGTAAWMEDEIYDAINDNRQYLVDSQLRTPNIPLDRGSSCCWQYGAWIWWRYLTERVADPSYVRDVWKRADGSPTGADQYSLQAARNALAARSLNIKTLYGDFAVWNRIPAAMYEEGANYPAPSASISHTLSPTKKSTGWVDAKLNHLTSLYIALKPGKAASANGHVTVRVDGPPIGWGSEARAMVFPTTGDVRVKPFVLNATGEGQLRLGFGKGSVTRVVVIMSNASQRYKCWQNTDVSCQGKPLDNNRPYAFRANLS
jgi:hypothetical protein